MRNFLLTAYMVVSTAQFHFACIVLQTAVVALMIVWGGLWLAVAALFTVGAMLDLSVMIKMAKRQQWHVLDQRV